MRYIPRDEGPKLYAAALAGTVHLLFFTLLIFGLTWQIRSPSPVSVELWSAPPPAPTQPPPAVREPPRPVQPVQPAPTPPAPPKEEPHPVQQPDIALEKEKQEKAAREEAERERERKKREEQGRLEREKKQREEQLRKERERLDLQARQELEDADRRRIQEQLAKESEQVESDLAKSQASAADVAASDAWTARIRSKIRSNIVIPDGLVGNPEAVFDVVQLPTGEIISVKLRKSSGFQAYDEAVERAIRKSSPLPKPERSSLFERDLRLTFRPQDQ